MEPTKITPEMVADLQNATVVNYAAPPGAEEDVNAVAAMFEIGIPGRFGPDRIYIPLMPDAEDLERLNAGEPLWLVFLSHRMPVFQTYIQPLPGDPHLPLIGGPEDGQYVARATVRGEDGALALRLHLDGTGSIYELSGASYYFVGDGAGPIAPEAPAVHHPVEEISVCEQDGCTNPAIGDFCERHKVSPLRGTEAGPE